MRSELRTSASTLSAAPSLSQSKVSIASSHSSQKSTSSKKSNKSDVPLTREEIIAQYIEKAKWYTSVGLGMSSVFLLYYE